MSTRKCMIDTDWTVGHGEPLIMSVCQQLYLIVSYKTLFVLTYFKPLHLLLYVNWYGSMSVNTD